MEGQQQRVESKTAFDGTGDGVGDVMQLEIEEHVLLRACRGADAGGALRGEEFEAELHTTHGARGGGDQALRARELSRVEGAENRVGVHTCSIAAAGAEIRRASIGRQLLVVSCRAAS